MSEQKRIPIGRVDVDTGRLVIVDPAYLGGKELQALLEQVDFIPTHRSDVPARQLHYSRSHAGLGVVLISGWGDDTYTVEADTFVDDNGFTIIREVRIRFCELEE